jgi:hypothetical protein
MTTDDVAVCRVPVDGLTVAAWRSRLAALDPAVAVVVCVAADPAGPGGWPDPISARSELGAADAVVTVAPVVDAVKRVERRGGHEVVVGEVDRSGLARPGLPQVVLRRALENALAAETEASGPTAMTAAMVVARQGGTVRARR